MTVNGQWPDQPRHVRPFLNPCLTEEELRDGAIVGSAKRLSSPLRLLFVGRAESTKGCGRAIEITEGLARRGIDARLEIVGDGPDRGALEEQIEAGGLRERVRLLGWVPRPSLNDLYASAHILLFPSTSSEGWPKVLSEGMAYGVVPVAGAVSSIPQYLEAFGAGRALDPQDREAFVDAIAAYVRDPRGWEQDASRAMSAAAEFTYKSYLGAVRRILGLEAV